MAVYKSEEPTKDGNSWYFKTYKKDFSGELKQYKSKKYATRKEAVQAEAHYLLNRDMPSQKGFYQIGDAFIRNCYKTKKESTALAYEQAYDKYILPYFKRYTMSSISSGIINLWKEEMLSKGFKITYLNKIYNVLKQIFDYAIQNIGLENNPAAIAGCFKQVNEDITTDEEKLRYITSEQFNEFIKNVDNEMYHLLFTMLFYTGIRKGELQALQFNDIDFNTREITINKTLSVKTKQGYKITNTKNYVNRKVAMNKILYDELHSYTIKMQNYKDYNADWFVFGGARFLPQTNIDRAKHLYFSRCNVPEITIHEFRHSHISCCINSYLKSGETDTTKFFLMMANRMGHSVEVMQRTYLHLFPSVQNEIINLLDNLE